MRLFEAAGNGVFEIVARARPAELGDHDALAGIHLAQPVIGADRFIDRGGAGLAFPVGQDVDGDEVDRRDKLGMILPHAPDFAGRDRHLRLALDALDDLDQPRDIDGFLHALEFFRIASGLGFRKAREFLGREIELLVADENGLAAIDRFVADHDAVDIGMLAGEIDRGQHFAFVALGVVAEPGAGRDLQADFVGDAGNEVAASGAALAGRCAPSVAE